GRVLVASKDSRRIRAGLTVSCHISYSVSGVTVRYARGGVVGHGCEHLVSSVSAIAVLPGSDIAWVSVADLNVDCSFRESGVNEEHVQLLAELDGQWPPVLVRRDDRLVIDGAHRVAAARLLGRKRIETEWFDGGADDALVEFVRR